MTTAFQEDLISSDFQALNLDFLIEILDIRRDILNDKDRDHRSYLKDFDIEYPEIECSVFDAGIEGGRQ